MHAGHTLSGAQSCPRVTGSRQGCNSQSPQDRNWPWLELVSPCPSFRQSWVHYSASIYRPCVHSPWEAQRASGPPSWEPEDPWQQLCPLPPTRTPGRHRPHPHLAVVEAGLGGTGAAPQFELDLTTGFSGFLLLCYPGSCTSPTSSEPRAFLFLAHLHESGLQSLQLGAPPARQPPCRLLRACPVPRLLPSTCHPLRRCLPPRCSPAQALSGDPVRKGLRRGRLPKTQSLL